MRFFLMRKLEVFFVRRVVVPLFSLVVVTGIGCLPSYPQTAGVAQISGTIQDPTGAAIAGAQVKITQIATSLVRMITSGDQGRYVAPALPVGPYQLEVTANGFKAYFQSGIVLQVGNDVEINVSMQLGSSSEHVDVQAEATMVETRDNAVSQVIDERRIVDLPLNGRQATQLILLSGAALATSTSGSTLTGTKSMYDSISISVAGGQGNAVNYLLDGGDNNDAYSWVNLPIPFPDALQEFSVQTSSVPARFGMHPAGVVNAVTKSGTNGWHGDFFEFLRNGDINARNFFAPVHDSLKRNQFGGTFGGRILRDKLFFFGGFQGTFNRSDPPQSVAFVPTPAVLNGDFSVIDGPGCISGGKTINLVDPTNGAPFSNDQIPVSRFNPASLAIMKSLPAAQNSCGKTTYGLISDWNDYQEVFRLDYVLNTKHTIFARYFIVDYNNPAPYDPQNILTSGQVASEEQSQSMTLGDTYIFRPTLLNSAHATFTRRAVTRSNPSGAPDPGKLGIDIPTYLPDLLFASVTGYFSVGCSTCKPAVVNVNSFSFMDDLDVIVGKHQMAFGVNLMRNQLNDAFPITASGQYSFNGQYATGKSMGDALAAFALGVMNDFQQGTPAARNATRQTVAGLYAQDSMRLTPRLTINIGLRWDPALVPYDYFNGGMSFSQAAFNAGQRSTVFTNAPAGLLFYGDQGIPQGFQNTNWAPFSPRLGIVWDPTGSGRQSIRISSAILRDTAELEYGMNFIQSPPYGTLIDRPFPFPAGTLSNPWGGYPGGSPFPLPSPLPSNYVFPTGGNYYVLPLDNKPPYMAQWGLSYERQITSSWLLSASYLGNKTTHVTVGEDTNPAQYIPGSSANTNLRRRLYLQNPTEGAYYATVSQADPGGNANYNALLLSIQHRFSHGFAWLTNYTWSHCLSNVDHIRSLLNSEYEDPYNREADYGNCDFDMRQQMTTSVIAISPVQGNGLAGRILGQWQLSPILQVRSGLPINVLDGTDISETGVNLDRPNYVSGVSPYLHTSNPLNYLNPAAFTPQSLGTFGNLGRNVLIGPGSINFDLALTRTFRIKERWQLTPRAEAFNVINHTNFGAPNTTQTSPQFGMITGAAASSFGGNNIAGAAGDPRIFQFALKVQF